MQLLQGALLYVCGFGERGKEREEERIKHTPTKLSSIFATVLIVAMAVVTLPPAFYLLSFLAFFFLCRFWRKGGWATKLFSRRRIGVVIVGILEVHWIHCCYDGCTSLHFPTWHWIWVGDARKTSREEGKASGRGGEEEGRKGRGNKENVKEEEEEKSGPWTWKSFICYGIKPKWLVCKLGYHIGIFNSCLKENS